MSSNKLISGNNEHHWLSISDMMSGLMIIFLFIAINYMLVLDKDKKVIEAKNESIKNITSNYKNTRKNLYEELNKEFAADLVKWDAKIDKETLSVEFQSPDVFFRQGDFNINRKFKDILDDFFPRFIKILAKKIYKYEIEEIRIEGHTSTEWNKRVSTDDAYIENMKLSQDRTRDVLKYVLNLSKKIIIENKTWIKSNLTANGLSSSKTKPEEGPENKELSRRVEFRIKTNVEQKIDDILRKLNENKNAVN